LLKKRRRELISSPVIETTKQAPWYRRFAVFRFGSAGVVVAALIFGFKSIEEANREQA
jgi:hypothetical protein